MQFSYQSVSFSEDVYFSWSIPNRATRDKVSLKGTSSALDYNDMTATIAGLNVVFPSALIQEVGFYFIISNPGIQSFNVQTVNPNDTKNTIATLSPGEILCFLLTNNGSKNGEWDIVPWGSGTSGGITSMTVDSPSGTLSVTGGEILPPGGTVGLDLSAPLNSLKNLSADGLVYYQVAGGGSFGSSSIQSDTNISVTNGDGIGILPIKITLNKDIKIDQIIAGNILVSDNVIKNNTSSGTGGGDVLVSATKNVIVNTALTVMSPTAAQTVGTVVAGGDLNVSGNIVASGSITNAFIPKAWGTFVDNGGTIPAVGQNIQSPLVGGTGIYTVSFINPMPSSTYAVIVSFAAPPSSTPPPDIIVQNIYVSVQTAASITFQVTNYAGGAMAAVNPVSFVVFSS